ncbi:g5002 [Coccomyxa elongata]
MICSMDSGASKKFGIAVLAIALASASSSNAELTITAQTPPPSTNNQPNTLVGQSESAGFAASLLASGTPVALWGLVPSSSVADACNQIVNTGGCNAASDESGTQFVFDTDGGRRIAVVCPQNAGNIGGGVYWTGSDVNQIYKDASTAAAGRRKVLGSSVTGRALADTAAQGDAGPGCLEGTPLEGTALCLALGPFAPLCGAGLFGACLAVNCAAGAGQATGCFPGVSTVLLSNGRSKPMHELRVGDEVAVMGKDGAFKLDAVYAFGHNDPKPITSFVKLTVDIQSLELSSLHFVPVYSGNLSSMVYKRAQDVNVGDHMYVGIAASGKGLRQSVTSITTTYQRGLYNPLTLSGNILVDGMVASVHSDWFLDATFDALRITGWLPGAYQVVLSPARLLYRILGKTAYVQLYNFLDAKYAGGLAGLGTRFGGVIFTGSACMLASMAAITASKIISLP